MSKKVEVNYETVWKTLSTLDCNDQVKNKMGLSYLSWAWAWGILMDNYPSARYVFEDNQWHQDGSETVHCTIEIDGDNGVLSRKMWLPVMDFKMKAINQPNSLDISNTKMRCLTKCMAMFGLGFYIYAGEDLPSAPEPKKVEKKKEPVSKPNTAKDLKESMEDKGLSTEKPMTQDEFESAIRDTFELDDDPSSNFKKVSEKALEDMDVAVNLKEVEAIWKKAIGDLKDVKGKVPSTAWSLWLGNMSIMREEMIKKETK